MRERQAFCRLYYIVSLHQTTTYLVFWSILIRCIISFLYIKPQLLHERRANVSRCIISFLYIKPQLKLVTQSNICVVLYRFSTSNHNQTPSSKMCANVVLYRFSTSNHNSLNYALNALKLYYIVSLHQTTTYNRA